MKIAAIIPARYASTRFPGKPLALINGKPMIEHVYKRVNDLEEITELIIATDNKRIYDTVQGFGAKAVMTSPDINSGTDRIARVAAEISADIVVNVQGDEPLLKKEMLREAIKPFYEDSSVIMSTLKKKIIAEDEINNPNIVKVVTDKMGNALYFSRYPLPYLRNERAIYYKHIGLYVYNKQFLLKYNQLEQTPLEKSESLEQLRVLENGYDIKVVETRYDSIGVDLPEDIARVERILSIM